MAIAVTACELGQVVVPQSEPIVIVQAIMRPDRPQHWIIVEQSLTGASQDVSQRSFVTGPVEAPVAGASVTVSNLSFPNDPCGLDVAFTETGGPASAVFGPDSALAGVYWAPPGCPTIRPGDTLALAVDAAGAVVTGRTVVPRADSILLRANGSTIRLPNPSLRFNRDLDTLTAEVIARSGRGVQLGIVSRPLSPRLISRSGPSTARFWVDSTAMTLPGDFVNVFEAEFEPDDDVPDLFVAGRHYLATVARPDDNYFDFIRSANSPLSGRGFINHLDGGFGLFGSMIVGTNELRVVGEVDDPRERTYRFVGDVEGVPVDLAMEVYLGRPVVGDADRVRFSAFATGDWVHGPLDHSVFGVLRGNALEASLRQDSGRDDEDGFPEIGSWTLIGVLSPSNATLTVVTEGGERFALVPTSPLSAISY